MSCDGLCFYQWNDFDQTWVFLYNTCAMIEDPQYFCGCIGTITGTGGFDGQIATKNCTLSAT